MAETLRYIADNAGENGHVVAAEVTELSGSEGYNAATGPTRQRRSGSGQDDPLDVAERRLDRMMLTTEALIVDKPGKREFRRDRPAP